MGARYRHLRSLDAAFLHMETTRTPMHNGSIAIFEGEPFFDRNGRFKLAAVRRHIEERVSSVPELRSVVHFGRPGGGEPVWVEDESFDITHHVRLTRLSGPGSDDALCELAVALHSELLDRTRPLWEMWLVEGLEGNRVAMIQKVHHALADGVSGMHLATALLDVRRHPLRGEERPRWGRPDPPASPGALLVDDLAQAAAVPIRAGERYARDLLHPVKALRRAAGLASGLESFMTPEIVAPRSSLNRQVASGRRLALLRVRLSEVKLVERRFGATVNDVILAAVTAGLRRVLEERGDPVDRLDLRALVPVSVRQAEAQEQLGNRVSAMFVSLPVHRPDALGRLRLVQDEVGTLKSRHQIMASQWLLDLTNRWPQAALAAASWIVHHQPFINLVVTNVPGPQFPLYMMGSEMLEVFPIVPLGGNLTVGVAILSYNGQLTLGVHVDPDKFSDLGTLIEGMDRGFLELAEAATGRCRVGGAGAPGGDRTSANVGHRLEAVN